MVDGHPFAAVRRLRFLHVSEGEGGQTSAEIRPLGLCLDSFGRLDGIVPGCFVVAHALVDLHGTDGPYPFSASR